MARRETLTWLLDTVRAEARLSQNPAHNSQVRDSQVKALQLEQRRLWDEYAWPHLRVERYIPVEAGQRYYDPAGAVNAAGVITNDLSIDRIESVRFKSDGEWMPVLPGIGASQYAAHDSALGARAWPACRWRIAEDEQIEVWPVPDIDATADDESGYMKLIGIRNLRPLVADADTCDLDGDMLALYVAGGILAATGAKDAQLKIERANKIRDSKRGNLSKTKSFQMFGVGERPAYRRPAITRYRAPGS